MIKMSNPEMVVLARESRGMTQEELAKSISVTQAYVSKYENGFLRIPDDVLTLISNVLDYPKEFFFLTDPVFGFGSSCFYHRKRKAIPMSELRRLQAKTNVLRIQLWRLLKGATIKPQIAFEPMDILDYEGSAEFVARSLRAMWHLPLGPVQNLTSVIESAGGIIFKFKFGTNKLDAISQWLPGLPPMFFVNSEAPGDRMRFTLAHELGHLIMHRVPTMDIEGQADRFAAELLMPAKEIRPHLTQLSLPKLANLKAYWKVSMQSIIYRAHALGKITQRQCRGFFTTMGKKGYRMEEPIYIPPEEPVLVKRIIEVHEQDHEYSVADLRRLVLANENDFSEIYQRDDHNVIKNVAFK
jgi:Zn-dependent peptidase ImmA (M78 family)/DNA-binding XRE family transcriptional regulator